MSPQDDTPDGLGQLDRLLIACVEAESSCRDEVLDSICSDHPEMAKDLRLRLDCLTEIGFLDESGPLDAMPPEWFGDFRILNRLGSGGMGVVYLAEQMSLGRLVALKLLHPEAMISTTARKRFRREGLTLSKLEHPGICPVYEVGETEGTPYMAMRYLEGQTLAELIRAMRDEGSSGCVRVTGQKRSQNDDTATGSETGTAPLHAVLELFEKVAGAVAVAHETGLVHRDLKPANIILTHDGKPVIVDFGLAYDESCGHELTMSGDTLGTPTYMAPEQIEARKHIDGRVDVYALGISLYESLTLTRPYEAASREALYRRILTGDAPEARTLNPKLPRDLSIVVAKAMDPDPDRRYQSALELAADLRRVRTHQPIEARRAGPLLRVWRWTQRNQIAAAFVLFLVLGLATTSLLLTRVEQSLQRTQALALANLAAKTAQTEPKAALWLAVQAHSRLDCPETRSQLYSALGQSHEIRRLTGHTAAVWAVRLSASGDRLLSCSDDGTARVWDLKHPGTAPIVLRHDGRDCIYDAQFALGDRYVVTTSKRGTGKLWDLARPDRWVWQFGPEDGRQARRIRVSRDGRTALLVRTNGALLVDLEARSVLYTLPHKGRLYDGCFSPDEQLVATAVGYGRKMADTKDFTVRLFRVRDGELLHELTGHTDSIHALRFSPDSKVLLTGSKDRTAQLWEVATGNPLGAPLHHPDPLWSGGFVRNASGHTVVLGGQGGQGILMWKHGRLQKAHNAGLVASIAFGSDGRFATASYDARARLFDSNGRQLLELRGHRNNVQDVALFLDGKRLATACWDGTIRIWRVEDRELTPLGLDVRGLGLSFALDGTPLWSERDTVHIGSTEIQGPLAIRAYLSRARPRFSPSGQLVVRMTQAGRVEVHRRDGTRVSGFQVDAERSLATFLGEDRLVVAQNRNVRRLSIRDLSGRLAGFDIPLSKDDNTLGIEDIAVDTTRQRLAICGANLQVTVLGFDGSVIGRLRGHRKSVVGVAFSPDGTRIATASLDGTARIFWTEEPTRAPILLEGHTAALHSVAFSLDGRSLVTSSKDGTARIWSVANGQEWARIETGSRRVTRASWSDDGKWIWTSSMDGFRRWPSSIGHLVELAQQRSHPDSANEQDHLHKLEASVLGIR